MGVRFRSVRIWCAVAQWCRLLVMDEYPDDRRERIRRERIDNIKEAVRTREAIRLWEIENQDL